MVAFRLVVLLAIVVLSYSDPAVNTEEVEEIERDTSIDIKDSEDVPELNRGRRLIQARGRDRKRCVAYLYVMAFTSGKRSAGSDRDHRIFIRTKYREMQASKVLPDLADDDYERNKGDLWKLPITFFFDDPGCIELDEIESLQLVGGTGDGWNIDSVVSFAISEDYYWALLSVDLDVFQWIARRRARNERRLRLSIIPYYDYHYDYYDYFHV